MKDHPDSSNGSAELPPGADGASATAVSSQMTSSAQPMSLAEWNARAAKETVPRVPQTVLSHLYQGCLARPPGRLIEAKRMYAKPIYSWLSSTAPLATFVTDPTEAEDS